MAVNHDSRSELAAALVREESERHVVLVYRREEELWDAIAAFFHAAIQHNERPVLVLDAAHPAAAARTALAKHAPDTEPLVAQAADVFCRDGAFDPERMSEQASSWADGAQADGRSGIALVTVLGPETETSGGAMRLADYGARINALIGQGGMRALCAYDVDRFSPETLQGVIAVHPAIIFDGTFSHNAHYVPPEEYLGPADPGRAVAHLLTKTRDRARAEEALRRSERDLRESNSRLRAVFNATRETLIYVDRRAIVLAANDTAAERLGTTADAMVGRCLYDYFPPEVVARRRKMFERVFQTGVSERHEEDVRGDRYFSSSYVPVRDASGEVEGAVVFAREVTESRAAARALAASESNYRDLVENAISIVLRVDWQGRITFANGFAAEFFGYGRDALIGRNLLGTIVPDDVPRATLLQELHAAQRQPAEAEVVERQCMRADGSRVWVAWTHRPVVDVASERQEIICIGSDLTRVKQSDEALRESERRLRTLLSNLPGMAYRCRNDDDWTMEFVSEGCQALTGFPPEELLYNRLRSYESVIHPEDREAVRTSVARAIARSRPFQIVYRIEDASGVEKWVWEQGRGVMADGVSYIEGFITDISDRKRAEEEIRNSEAQYRGIFFASTDGLMISDGEGHVLDANPAAAHMHGYTLDEFRRITPEAIIDRDSLGAYESFVNAIAAGNAFHGVSTNVRKDGSRFPVEVLGAPLMFRGRPQFLGILRDITERVRAEKERRELEVKYHQAQRLESLGVMAGGIAHDFNNLLMGVLGNADIALSELPEASPLHETLSNIRSAALRSADLCRQLLAYSGKGRIDLRPLDLSALVRDMGQLLEVSFGKKVRPYYELSGNLPPIDGDPSQLRQVIMNLLINASEAIGDREGVIRIATGVTVRSEQDWRRSYFDESMPEGQYVFLEVADSGPGMDPQMLRKVFEPFYTTKFAGRGLGLAAVLGIVRGHRAAIDIETALGCGTTFRVYFPCSEGEIPPEPERNRPEPLWRGSGVVLVVDDDDAVRAVAQRMLEMAGLTVKTAAAGEQALDILREDANAIDAVLLDMTMPDYSASQLLEAIGRVAPKLPVVLSSGFDYQGTGPYEGGAGFLQKPYQMAALIEQMRTVLEGGKDT